LLHASRSIWLLSRHSKNMHAPLHILDSNNDVHSAEVGGNGGQPRHAGALIINADDFGRDCWNTQRILECFAGGGISSVSAMVFMEDSERAAAIAQERGIDAGLHLNLTTPFSPATPALLREHQQRLARYLERHRLARLIFHPGLAGSFDYVVRKQFDEFNRIYSEPPARIDGHHHMHHCANVVLAKLLPAGTVVRRNFSFQSGEKSWANRTCRNFLDRMLVRRHRLTDYFFSLAPVEQANRLQRIFSLAEQSIVEVETHPINLAEYRFLSGGGIFHLAGSLSVARDFAMPAKFQL
jgi:predicted glycoside hydrolase/deacetylase ChbG (UPF0249 family)